MIFYGCDIMMFVKNHVHTLIIRSRIRSQNVNKILKVRIFTVLERRGFLNMFI